MNKQNNTKTRLLLQKGKWGLLSAIQDLLSLSQHVVLGDKTTRLEHELTAGDVDHTQVVPHWQGLPVSSKRQVFFCWIHFFAFSKAGGSIATNSSNKFLSQLLTTLRGENAPLDNSGSHQVPLLSAAAVPGFSRPT